ARRAHGGPPEERKEAAVLRVEHIAARAHEAAFAPACERLVRLEAHLDRIGKTPAHGRLAHPWDAARRLAHGAERCIAGGDALDALRERFEIRARDASRIP